MQRASGRFATIAPLSFRYSQVPCSNLVPQGYCRSLCLSNRQEMRSRRSGAVCHGAPAALGVAARTSVTSLHQLQNSCGCSGTEPNRTKQKRSPQCHIFSKCTRLAGGGALPLLHTHTHKGNSVLESTSVPPWSQQCSLRLQARQEVLQARQSWCTLCRRAVTVAVHFMTHIKRLSSKEWFSSKESFGSGKPTLVHFERTTCCCPNPTLTSTCFRSSTKT